MVSVLRGLVAFIPGGLGSVAVVAHIRKLGVFFQRAYLPGYVLQGRDQPLITRVSVSMVLGS